MSKMNARGRKYKRWWSLRLSNKFSREERHSPLVETVSQIPQNQQKNVENEKYQE